MDYSDSRCCFDASQYTGHPDTQPCPCSVNVPELVKKLDELQNSGRLAAARELIEHGVSSAHKSGDWRSELSLQSELMGLHRRTGDRAAAQAAVDRGLELTRLHHLGDTVSGATIMLNAATTMKFLGLSADALPIFRHVSRVFGASLDPADYRFAGLYNNMALSMEDVGDFDGAQRHFFMALDIIRLCRDPGNDEAVTWCNLAELYERMGLDDKIESSLDNAYACLTDPELPRDGYHAFTLSKCIPTFDRLGYFIYTKSLKERLEAIK